MILAAASSSTSAWDQPGTIAFLIVFGMCVVMYFVFRSMSRHLRKINEAARLEALQAETGPANAGSRPAGQAAGDGFTGLPASQDGTAKA